MHMRRRKRRRKKMEIKFNLVTKSNGIFSIVVVSQVELTKLLTLPMHKNMSNVPNDD